MKFVVWLVGICVALLSLGGGAQAQDNFFAGKRINLVVAFAPGGGTDVYARLLAKHITRHIPGNPTIVVQNLPGAAGLRAVSTLSLPEASDGTTIVSFNPSLVVETLLSPEEAKTDFNQIQWLGAVDKITRVCYVWATTGLTSLEDMRKRDRVIFGVSGDGATGTEESILERILGVKLKLIKGYNAGAADTRLALERGEVEGNCGAWSSVSPDWLREKKVNVVVRFQKDANKSIPTSIPYVGDLITDQEKLRIIDLLEAGSSLGRPFILSKDVPAARVKLLREAFDKTVSDPEFLAEAEKAFGVISPTPGTQLQEMVKTLYATPASAMAEAKKIAGK